jgi:hypothetical protein
MRSTFANGHWCFFFDSNWSPDETYSDWIDGAWEVEPPWVTQIRNQAILMISTTDV